MSFMELETVIKGATYSCECGKCGATLFTHEWVYLDHNERKDAMKRGALICDHCGIGRADPETFMKLKDMYACRYSAAGYLDCTQWEFGTNRRTLERDTRDLYV